MRWRISKRLSVIGATCLALSVASGCSHGRASVVPNPPTMPLDVILELDEGQCPMTEEYLFVEVEGYFEGIRAMRR